MFGYIRPYKPRMEKADYELYKASYCGLCKELKKFGITSRMTLSYDFAFLLILYMAVNETEITFDEKSCMAHPLKKRKFVKSCDALTFTATVECISVYHKLKDDISDDKFVKKTAAKTLLSGMRKPYKKAEKLLPELSSLTEEKMKLQKETEDKKTKSIDMAAEPTATIMSAMAGEITSNPEKKRILMRMGYLLGRFIYLCDALDDMESDYKTGGYNPLLLQEEEYNPEKIRSLAKDSIYFTLGELSNAYVLLGDIKYKTITDNVIYMGLPFVAEKLLKGESITKGKKSSFLTERNENKNE